MRSENPYATPLDDMQSERSGDAVSSYTKQGATIGAILASILFAFESIGKLLEEGAIAMDIYISDVAIVTPSAVVFVLFPAVGALTGILVGVICRNTGA